MCHIVTLYQLHWLCCRLYDLSNLAENFETATFFFDIRASNVTNAVSHRNVTQFNKWLFWSKGLYGGHKWVFKDKFLTIRKETCITEFTFVNKHPL